MAKYTNGIEKINLSATKVGEEDYAATYNDVEIMPSWINFFYGNNGTGKSSVAKVIRDQVGVFWRSGFSPDTCDVLLYDKEFIKDNFASYNSIRGIYTERKTKSNDIDGVMGEEGKATHAELEAMKARLGELRKNITIATESLYEKKSVKSNLLIAFQDDFCKAGADVRRGFSKAKALQGKVGRNDTFANFALELSVTPVAHDLEAMKEFYDIAYDSSADSYDYFESLDLTSLKLETECELLDKAIVSASNSTFADTIKRLGQGGFEWVIIGHEKYEPNAGDSCPYCQKPLGREEFERQLKACFDDEYKSAIVTLRNFSISYKLYVHGLIDRLNGNLTKKVYPKLETELVTYRDKVEALETVLKLNIKLIDGKIKEPSLPIVEKLSPVEQLCAELNELIETFNKRTKENNDIVKKQDDKKKECDGQILARLAHDVKGEKTKYRQSEKKIIDEITALDVQITVESNEAEDIERDIENTQVTSIEPAVDEINRILDEANFQGFRLETSGEGQSTYRVMRGNRPAKNSTLSEGEQNFIAFLYFYYLVRGNHSNKKLDRNKIVVIDDPVTSMDSGVLFIVSSLIRDLVDDCFIHGHKEGKIRQIFILTHNPYFHKEVSFARLTSDATTYRKVSFYEVRKQNNTSDITLCEKENVGAEDGKENYSPVQNYYTALWNEYKLLLTTTDGSTTATLLSVIQRIIEYHFMQLCSYKIEDVRKETLNEIGDDANKHKILNKMLQHIYDSKVTSDDSDSQFYIADYSINEYEEVFKQIFKAMGQMPHYLKMSGEG